MKQIKVSDSVHEKLKAISEKRKDEDALTRSNLAITEKLITDLYKKEFS